MSTIQDKYNQFLQVALEDGGGSAGGVKMMAGYVPSDTRKILCIGCGIGWEVEHLRSKGFDTVGITLNPEQANKPYIYCMDMHNMDFPDKSFDFVWIKDTFEHAISPIMAICEYARVTEMGKYVMIATPGEEKYGKDPCHWMCPTPLQMLHIGEKAGLLLIDIHGQWKGIHPYDKGFKAIRQFLWKEAELDPYYRGFEGELYKRNFNPFLFKKIGPNMLEKREVK